MTQMTEWGNWLNGVVIHCLNYGKLWPPPFLSLGDLPVYMSYNNSSIRYDSDHIEVTQLHTFAGFGFELWPNVSGRMMNHWANQAVFRRQYLELVMSVDRLPVQLGTYLPVNDGNRSKQSACRWLWLVSCTAVYQGLRLGIRYTTRHVHNTCKYTPPVRY